MLESARAKIKRAKKHLAEVEELIKAFRDSNPYALRRETDEEAGTRSTTIHHLVDVPEDIPLAIGDCVHNCRAALDHLAWDLVRKGGTHDPSKNRHLRFPIHRTKKDFAEKLCTNVQGAPAAALPLIKRLKPYGRADGGNECFAILTALDNRDKHRFIVLIIPTVKSVNVDFAPLLRGLWEDKWEGLPPMVLKMRPKDTSADHGEELFATRADEPFDENLTVDIQIAFDESGVPDGEPVTVVLHQLINFTERVIDLFDRAIFSK